MNNYAESLKRAYLPPVADKKSAVTEPAISTNVYYGTLQVITKTSIASDVIKGEFASFKPFNQIWGTCFALLGLTLSSTLFASDSDKLVEVCFSCHGVNGVNSEAKIPTIAGYSADYFGFSLGMYKRHERPCVDAEYRSGSKKGLISNMCDVVKDLSEGDVELVSDFFSRQKFVRTVQTFDAELAKKGETIYLSKCEPCHTKSGTSPTDNIGILGGQKIDYLREQIKFVREGKRFTSKKMKVRLDALNDADLEAVVNYFGSIQ